MRPRPPTRAVSIPHHSAVRATTVAQPCSPASHVPPSPGPGGPVTSETTAPEVGRAPCCHTRAIRSRRPRDDRVGGRAGGGSGRPTRSPHSSDGQLEHLDRGIAPRRPGRGGRCPSGPDPPSGRRPGPARCSVRTSSTRRVAPSADGPAGHGVQQDPRHPEPGGGPGTPTWPPGGGRRVPPTSRVCPRRCRRAVRAPSSMATNQRQVSSRLRHVSSSKAASRS